MNAGYTKRADVPNGHEKYATADSGLIENLDFGAAVAITKSLVLALFALGVLLALVQLIKNRFDSFGSRVTLLKLIGTRFIHNDLPTGFNRAHKKM